MGLFDFVSDVGKKIFGNSAEHAKRSRITWRLKTLASRTWGSIFRTAW